MSTSRNAIIVIAGITLTAPTDLVSAAGYEPYSDGSPSRSRWPVAETRLMRALSERGAPAAVGQEHHVEHSIRLLLRVVELAEIERTEAAKTEQHRLIAQSQARAAADERAAAGISLAAQRLRDKN
jgi:hypothetical protein